MEKDQRDRPNTAEESARLTLIDRDGVAYATSRGLPPKAIIEAVNANTEPRTEREPRPLFRSLRELAAMASRFPSLRTLPLRPWNASRIAAAFRGRFDDADGALHVEGGRAAAALAILFMLDPTISPKWIVCPTTCSPCSAR
jgi:hypothetical protein